MTGVKRWFQSKGIITGVVTVAVAAYASAAAQFGLPPIPEWVFMLLGSLGIYSRAVADKRITS